MRFIAVKKKNCTMCSMCIQGLCECVCAMTYFKWCLFQEWKRLPSDIRRVEPGAFVLLEFWMKWVNCWPFSFRSLWIHCRKPKALTVFTVSFCCHFYWSIHLILSNPEIYFNQIEFNQMTFYPNSIKFVIHELIWQSLHELWILWVLPQEQRLIQNHHKE